VRIADRVQVGQKTSNARKGIKTLFYYGPYIDYLRFSQKTSNARKGIKTAPVVVQDLYGKLRQKTSNARKGIKTQQLRTGARFAPVSTSENL